jgi:hypothetical protein
MMIEYIKILMLILATCATGLIAVMSIWVIIEVIRMLKNE